MKTRLAYHEAGHAVMAYYSFVDGRRVSFASVSIQPARHKQRQTLGHVDLSGLAGPVLESCEAEAKISYAGHVAESIHYNEDIETRAADGSIMDILQAAHAIEEYVEHLHGTDDEDLTDFYSSMFRQATGLALRSSWPAVEALAAALLRFGQLTGPEAVSIIEGVTQ